MYVGNGLFATLLCENISLTFSKFFQCVSRDSGSLNVAFLAVRPLIVMVSLTIPGSAECQERSVPSSMQSLPKVGACGHHSDCLS